MGKTAAKVESNFRNIAQFKFEGSVRRSLSDIAKAIDELRESQNLQKPTSEFLDSKKAKALMVVIQKIVAVFEHEQVDIKLFKLFETAKAIKRAETETDFQSAVA